MFHMIFPNLQLYLSISRATKYWLNLMNKTKKRTKIDVMLDFTQWYQKLSIWKYGQSVDSVSLNVGDAPRRQSCEFPLGPASVMELGGLTSSVEFCPSPSQHLRQHSLTIHQHLPYSHVTDKETGVGHWHCHCHWLQLNIFSEVRDTDYTVCCIQCAEQGDSTINTGFTRTL